MPNPDDLMDVWPNEMEQALREIPFPGPEIDMHAADYAKLVCSMLDIPCHKLANNKSVIESLHVLFTTFSDFRIKLLFNGEVIFWRETKTEAKIWFRLHEQDWTPPVVEEWVRKLQENDHWFQNKETVRMVKS